jgi:hypothetical protein
MTMQKDTIAGGGTGFRRPSETRWRALVCEEADCIPVSEEAMT